MATSSTTSMSNAPSAAEMKRAMSVFNRTMGEFIKQAQEISKQQKNTEKTKDASQKKSGTTNFDKSIFRNLKLVLDTSFLPFINSLTDNTTAINALNDSINIESKINSKRFIDLGTTLKSIHDSIISMQTTHKTPSSGLGRSMIEAALKNSINFKDVEKEVDSETDDFEIRHVAEQKKYMTESQETFTAILNKMDGLGSIPAPKGPEIPEDPSKPHPITRDEMATIMSDIMEKIAENKKNSYLAGGKKIGADPISSKDYNHDLIKNLEKLLHNPRDRTNDKLAQLLSSNGKKLGFNIRDSNGKEINWKTMDKWAKEYSQIDKKKNLADKIKGFFDKINPRVWAEKVRDKVDRIKFGANEISQQTKSLLTGRNAPIAKELRSSDPSKKYIDENEFNQRKKDDSMSWEDKTLKQQHERLIKGFRKQQGKVDTEARSKAGMKLKDFGDHLAFNNEYPEEAIQSGETQDIDARTKYTKKRKFKRNLYTKGLATIRKIFRAEGGGVPGTGNTDSVPAMLTPGEFVIKKSTVSKLGESFFNKLNEGDLSAASGKGTNNSVQSKSGLQEHKKMVAIFTAIKKDVHSILMLTKEQIRNNSEDALTNANRADFSNTPGVVGSGDGSGIDGATGRRGNGKKDKEGSGGVGSLVTTILQSLGIGAATTVATGTSLGFAGHALKSLKGGSSVSRAVGAGIRGAAGESKIVKGVKVAGKIRDATFNLAERKIGTPISKFVEKNLPSAANKTGKVIRNLKGLNTEQGIAKSIKGTINAGNKIGGKILGLADRTIASPTSKFLEKYAPTASKNTGKFIGKIANTSKVGNALKTAAPVLKVAGKVIGPALLAAEAGLDQYNSYGERKEFEEGKWDSKNHERDGLGMSSLNLGLGAGGAALTGAGLASKGLAGAGAVSAAALYGLYYAGKKSVDAYNDALMTKSNDAMDAQKQASMLTSARGKSLHKVKAQFDAGEITQDELDMHKANYTVSNAEEAEIATYRANQRWYDVFDNPEEDEKKIRNKYKSQYVKSGEKASNKQKYGVYAGTLMDVAGLSADQASDFMDAHQAGNGSNSALRESIRNGTITKDDISKYINPASSPTDNPLMGADIPIMAVKNATENTKDKEDAKKNGAAGAANVTVLPAPVVVMPGSPQSNNVPIGNMKDYFTSYNASFYAPNPKSY